MKAPSTSTSVAEKIERRPCVRWLQSLVRTVGSADEVETGCALFLDARLTSGKLESRVHLLWLAHATLEKSAPNVLPSGCVRQPQQIYARFKLATGQARVEEHSAPGLDLVGGPDSAYEALWPSYTQGSFSSFSGFVR